MKQILITALAAWLSCHWVAVSADELPALPVLADENIVHDDGTGAQISFYLPTDGKEGGEEVEYSTFRIMVVKDGKFLLFTDLAGSKSEDGNVFFGKIVIPSGLIGSAEFVMLGSPRNSSLGMERRLKVSTFKKDIRDKCWVADSLEPVRASLEKQVGGAWQVESNSTWRFLSPKQLPPPLDTGTYAVFVDLDGKKSLELADTWASTCQAPFFILGTSDNCTVLTTVSRKHSVSKAAIKALGLKEPETASPAEELLVRDEAKKVIAQQNLIEVVTKYRGRIATSPLPAPQEGFELLPFAKETVIRNQDEYERFVARLPKMEPLNTKGDDHPNDDPLLKKPAVDFTRNMLLAVARESMYLPPEITRIVVSDKNVLVYTEEDPGETANYQQEGGLGTYCAVVVARTDKPVVFRKTITTTRNGSPFHKAN